MSDSMARKRRSKTRNVLFFQYPWRLWRERLAGVHRYAKEAGWQVRVVEYERHCTSISAALKFWKPDGLIVEGGYTELAGFRQVDFKGYPVVFCDVRASRMRKGYSGMAHDPFETAALAAKTLLSFGFPYYAYVGNRQLRDWCDHRCETFAKAISAAGKSCVAFKPDAAEDFDTFREKLKPWLAALPRPCGLLAANDTTADVVLHVLRRMRVKVPEEIAVVGIDNDPLICENTTPTLTSVAPDFESSGYLAAEMLDARMKDRSIGDEIRTFFAVQVIRRGSTRILKRRDEAIKKALEFIRERISDGISARDVIRRIGGSRRRAEYRFRELVGLSIGEEIKAVRLAAARKLLADPSLPIGLVTARCGYSSDASFRRLFKAAEGLTLSAYRKALANGDWSPAGA